MVVKADHERIKTLLKDTITLLCRNGLNFKTEFSVEALIGITLDKEDVVLVSINEIIRTELGTQLALAKDAEERNATMRSSDQDGSSESQPGTPLSTNGHQYRKRKHSSGHGSQREPLDDEQESDSADEDGRSFEKASAASPLVDESNSEPSNKRSLDDSNAPATRIKDDDTKDVIYIKEEIDTGDWPDGSHTQDSFTDPNIPAAGTSDQQHDDNFDFLHGGSLVPISSDSTMPQSWSDVAQSAPPGMNISPSKRSSTAVGTPTQGDQSQQTVIGTKSQTDNAAAKGAPSDGKNLVRQMLGHPVVQHQPASCSYRQTALPQMPLSNLNPPTQVEGFLELGEYVTRIRGAELAIKTETGDREAAVDVTGMINNDAEVRQVNASLVPLLDIQDVDPGVFAGVELPTRRNFADPNFTAKCPVCEKSFSTYQGFMRHVDHHRGRYAFFCSVCGRGFMTKDHLGNHVRGHTGEKLYCDCGAGFKTHQALRMHRKREQHERSIAYDERWLNWGVPTASSNKA